MKKSTQKVSKLGMLITVGLLAFTACGTSGDAAAETDETVSVTIAVPPSVNGLGPATALEEGLFEKAGLDVEIEQIQSGSEGAALLAGGDAQFAQFSMDNAINSVVEGHDNVITVPTGQQGPERSEDPHSSGSIVVDPEGDIETLQDLEGKQIGTSVLGGEAYLNAFQTLQEAGVDTSTVEWIQIPGPQHVSSVRQGQVAAAVTAEPNLSIALLKDEIKPIADVNGALPNAPSFGLASDRGWAEENPEVVAAVQAAVLEAHALLNSDREVAERILESYMGLDEEVIATVKLPQYPEEQFTVDQLTAVADRLVEFDLLEEGDTSAVEEVLFIVE